MSQSRTHSAVEALTGTVLGAGGSWLISYWFIRRGADPIAATNAVVVGCTVWSMVRGYLVRRTFNWLHKPPATQPQQEGPKP